MPIDTHPARRGRHPEEIIKEQKAQAEKDKARANARKTVATAVVPTKPDTTAVTVPVSDTRTEVQRYIDEIAPASISGRLIKFSKDGHFVTAGRRRADRRERRVHRLVRRDAGWLDKIL
jgi:hypothetical protein